MMMQPGTQEAIMDVATQLVTWVLVVVGWLVVVDQTEHRELAKVAISRIGGLRDLIRTLEEDALKFHGSEFDEALANSIMRQIKKFSDEAVDLNKLDLVSMTLGMSAQSLRQSITLKNFDASTHTALARGDEILGNIRGHTDLIDSQLMRASSTLSSKPRRLRTTLRALVRRI